MNRLLTVATLAAVAAASSCVAEPRRITREALEDKIRGGWAGQMIGVAYAAPTEFQALGRTNDAEIAWSPDLVGRAINQDDLYVEMTFAEVMDRVGLEATTAQYGEMFGQSKYELWHANAAARRNLARGHLRAAVRRSQAQHPRQRHRLPDRVRLHRPDVPRAAPGVRTCTPTGWVTS